MFSGLQQSAAGKATLLQTVLRCDLHGASQCTVHSALCTVRGSERSGALSLEKVNKHFACTAVCSQPACCFAARFVWNAILEDCLLGTCQATVRLVETRWRNANLHSPNREKQKLPRS